MSNALPEAIRHCIERNPESSEAFVLRSVSYDYEAPEDVIEANRFVITVASDDDGTGLVIDENNFT